ncbi:hypothetical protein AB0F46_04750 [Streptomyces sp. NPDC026665]|uniref:hypothetical protein n=1 Tax=Streptomyces sp. NPDC026665 TaxID=3154798 RepID=UPI0033D0780C
MGASQIGMMLLTAWIAQEQLWVLLALARTGADHERVGHLRWEFLTWCADSEVRQLAVTLDPWWHEIGVRRDRPQQRHQRGQPDDQAVRTEWARLQEPGQPADTHMLRHHPPSPRTPSHAQLR